MIRFWCVKWCFVVDPQEYSRNIDAHYVKQLLSSSHRTSERLDIDSLEIGKIAALLSFYPMHGENGSGMQGGGLLSSTRASKGLSGMLLRRVNVQLEEAKVNKNSYQPGD